VNGYGDTLVIDPLSFEHQCPEFPEDNKATVVHIIGKSDANFYILFTETNLGHNEKVSIIVPEDEKKKTVAECVGDSSNFCAPIVLLKNEFYFKLPPFLSENAIKIVVVSTTHIPYSYYAYSQLPAWATVVTVFITFVFLFLMTLMCCCCMLMMCRRHRRASVVTASPLGRRTHSDGPPVYSTANPVIFDIPPTYVEHEQAPPMPQKSL
jgi:hypothetical protein